MPPPSSILVVGASSPLGLEVLHELSRHPRKPDIHSYSQDELSEKERALCTSVITGDDSQIEKAVIKTGVDFLILCPTDGRIPGKAAAQIMSKPEFCHVRAIVVSSAGAGKSHINIGFGIGTLIYLAMLRPLKDFTQQETAFQSLKERIDIVRPMRLTSGAKGKVYEFGDNDFCPNIECNLRDAAKWIVADIYGPSFGGRTINIATSKRKM